MSAVEQVDIRRARVNSLAGLKVVALAMIFCLAFWFLYNSRPW